MRREQTENEPEPEIIAEIVEEIIDDSKSIIASLIYTALQIYIEKYQCIDIMKDEISEKCSCQSTENQKVHRSYLDLCDDFKYEFNEDEQSKDYIKSIIVVKDIAILKVKLSKID